MQQPTELFELLQHFQWLWQLCLPWRRHKSWSFPNQYQRQLLGHPWTQTCNIFAPYKLHVSLQWFELELESDEKKISHFCKQVEIFLIRQKLTLYESCENPRMDSRTMFLASEERLARNILDFGFISTGSTKSPLV